MFMCLITMGTFLTCSYAAEPASVISPPEMQSYTYTIYKNQSVTDFVYCSYTGEGELVYKIDIEPLHGKAVINQDKSWTYTPVEKFFGEDGFSVKVSDESDTYTAAALIKITVKDNNAPAVPDYKFNVYRNNSVSKAVYGNDADGDVLIYNKFLEPVNGSVDVSSNEKWTYTPNHDYIGTDYFQVAVDDGKGGLAVSTITIEAKNETHNLSSNVVVSNDGNKSDNKTYSYNKTDNENKAINTPEPPPIQNAPPTQNLQQNAVVPNAAAFEEQSENSQVPMLEKRSVEEKKADKEAKKEAKEIIPAGIAKLPKTGGIPPFLFYGIGGMLVTAGILFGRDTK